MESINGRLVEDWGCFFGGRLNIWKFAGKVARAIGKARQMCFPLKVGRSHLSNSAVERVDAFVREQVWWRKFNQKVGRSHWAKWVGDARWLLWLLVDAVWLEWKSRVCFFFRRFGFRWIAIEVLVEGFTLFYKQTNTYNKHSQKLVYFPFVFFPRSFNFSHFFSPLHNPPQQKFSTCIMNTTQPTIIPPSNQTHESR